MDGRSGKLALITSFLCTIFDISQAQEYCRELNYWCREGHCCGRGKCCTYYYEIWWFWSIWILVAMVLLWCYFHRRIREASQRIRDIHSRQLELTPIVTANAAILQNENRLTAREQNYSTLFGNSTDAVHTKLPSYNEVGELPKDPPPYNHIVFANLPNTSIVENSLLPPNTDLSLQQLEENLPTSQGTSHLDINHQEMDDSEDSISKEEEESETGESLPEYTEQDCGTPLLPEAGALVSTRTSPPPPYKSTENLPNC